MSKRTIILISLTAFILISLGWIQQQSLVIPYKTMSGSNNVGDTATNFTLSDIYGNKYTLYDFKGQIIFLHVGSTG